MTRLGAALLVIGVATAAAVGTGAPVADAQQGARIDLVAQTLRVDGEPAFIEIAIENPPDDAQLSFCVAPAVTDLTALRDTREEPPTNCRIVNFSRPVEFFAVEGVPDRYRYTIPDDPPDGVGELLRRDPGALPVVITLETDERVLDTVVTQLLVLDPDADPTSATTTIGFVADARVPVAHLPDQTVADPSPDLLAALERLTPYAELPFAVEITPESLSAAAATAPATLEGVRAATADKELLLAPWVNLDEEAWRAVGETTMVLDQYSAGRTVTEELLGASPRAIVRVDPDTTAATVALLRAAGAGAMILDGDHTTVDPETATGRPVQTRDDNGVPMTGLVYDDQLAATLDEPDTELAVNQALADLLLPALGDPGDRAVLLDLDVLDPETTLAFVDAIAAEPELATGPVSTLLEVTPARTGAGTTVTVRLRPDDSSDMSERAATIAAADARVTSYATMVPSTDAPVAPLHTLLDVAVAADLTDTESAEYTTAVHESIGRQTADVTVLDSERITLTTRTADLPLVIRNGQTVNLRVDLELRAEKLRFPEGDRLTIDLEPGDNPLTVSVETQASGDARVIVTVSSPDGRLQLDEAAVRVRSTALSGIGLLISALALAVLLVWWIRTVRRTRRRRGAATVPEADADADGPTPGGPGGSPPIDAASGEEP